MRLAITSTGPSLDNALDEHFGRARYILIVDLETESVEAIDNHANFNAPQGAGINAAQSVADRGAEWVLTGHAGPKAFAALHRAGIRVAAVSGGSCRDALERFRRGELQAIAGPDVESHWG
ncbi:MAG TPA: dinitrogenase iron-molybdenum cofactor biosynthesis protein [Firmicutes bacterium]|nr:dinitrogenase iron-molybdenum cofactor biosynthesis protein [Bacillota bacterium]